MIKLPLKYLAVFCYFLFSGCNQATFFPYDAPEEAAELYIKKGKCVVELNYHPNVEGLKKPLKVDETLSRLSNREFPVLSDTKIKDSRPDFYKYFISYDDCQETKQTLLNNKNFGKCIISVRDINITDYLNLYTNGSQGSVASIKIDDPLKCIK